MGYIEVVSLAYGVIWCALIPLVLLSTYEHFFLKNVPQGIVMTFITFSTITRAVWYFLSYYKLSADYCAALITRLSILSELSGISFLLLLWSGTFRARSVLLLQRNLTDPYSLHKIVIIGFLNIFFWIFVISTTSKRGSTEMDINIVFTSILCIVFSLIITYLGLVTGVKLQKQFQPVYAMKGPASPSTVPSSSLRLLYFFLFDRKAGISNMLELQRASLFVILRVSMSLSIANLVRSLCDLYRLEHESIVNNQTTTLEKVIYPNLYYAFPDIVILSAITFGLSSKNMSIAAFVRYVLGVQIPDRIVSIDLISGGDSATTESYTQKNSTSNIEEVVSVLSMTYNRSTFDRTISSASSAERTTELTGCGDPSTYSNT